LRFPFEKCDFVFHLYGCASLMSAMRAAGRQKGRRCCCERRKGTASLRSQNLHSARLCVNPTLGPLCPPITRPHFWPAGTPPASATTSQPQMSAKLSEQATRTPIGFIEPLLRRGEELATGFATKEKIEWAPRQIPWERRLQTAAAIVWVGLLPLLTIGLNIICVLWRPLRIPYLLYCAYVVFDTRPENGGAPSQWFRGLGLWRSFADYFPSELVKTAEIDTSGPVLFGTSLRNLLECSRARNADVQETNKSRVPSAWRHRRGQLHKLYNKRQLTHHFPRLGPPNLHTRTILQNSLLQRLFTQSRSNICFEKVNPEVVTEQTWGWRHDCRWWS